MVQRAVTVRYYRKTPAVHNRVQAGAERAYDRRVPLSPASANEVNDASPTQQPQTSRAGKLLHNLIALLRLALGLCFPIRYKCQRALQQFWWTTVVPKCPQFVNRPTIIIFIL